MLRKEARLESTPPQGVFQSTPMKEVFQRGFSSSKAGLPWEAKCGMTLCCGGMSISMSVML